MSNKSMNIAIIPARSGSKGLVNKNIKVFCGKPLLVHSIECAIKSGVFDEVFVSTDSLQYADIAVEYGGTVPFLRDTCHSDDTSSMWDVLKDSLLKYESLG